MRRFDSNQIFFTVYEIGYINMHILLDNKSSLVKSKLGESTSVRISRVFTLMDMVSLTHRDSG
jgi:hypothetical protein